MFYEKRPEACNFIKKETLAQAFSYEIREISKNWELAASTRKEKFRTNNAWFKLGSTETELNKRKISSPIICELDTPVSSKTVSSKSSRVDFDVAIDKPSKQEPPRSSKIQNCPVIEVKQTVQHSDEQVNARKEIQTAQTENINNADNNTVQENNEWRKGTTVDSL